MKKLTRMAIIAIFAMTFQACSLNNDPLDDGNHRIQQQKSNKVYRFQLSLGGDYVEQSEEPLTKANEPNTYVGINVTCKDKSKTNPDPENYAYGVFTSKDNIYIDLISGYTYDFEATILRDRTDKYHHDSTNDYQSPFGFYPNNTSTGNPVQYPTNKVGNFEYNYLNKGAEALGFLSELSSGTAKVQISDNDKVPEYAKYMFPRVDRYYGTITDIDPTILADKSESIEISLLYRCFGLTIDAQNIPEGTSITINDVSNRNGSIETYLVFPKNLELGPGSENISIWKEIYSTNDLKSSDYFTFDLEITWHRGLSDNKKIPASISVKTGINKVLKISINGTPNTKYPSNIILTEIDTSLTDEEQNENWNYD